MAATAVLPRLEFGAFLDTLGSAVGRDLTGATPDTGLRDELHWDSLDMLAALAVLDEHGAHLPEELPSELRTVGDLFHYLDVLGGSSVPAKGDPLVGPNVSLVPFDATAEQYLYRLCTAGRHLTHFRLRGFTPSPEAFRHLVWDKVIAQFLVTTAQGPVGWVSAYDPDFRNRYAHLAAVADPDFADTGFVAEGAALLTSYVFAQFDLRKVYAESLDMNYERFRSGEHWLFEVEGRLTAHEYLDGGYHDLLTLAASRDRWREVHRRIFRSEPGF